jgi:hypothetical protein
MNQFYKWFTVTQYLKILTTADNTVLKKVTTLFVFTVKKVRVTSVFYVVLIEPVNQVNISIIKIRTTIKLYFQTTTNNIK